MTSVQDYLRNLRAARKDFVSTTANEASPSPVSPTAAASSAVTSSPWLKPPASIQSTAVAPRSDLGRGEPALATGQGAARATSTPLKASQAGLRGPSVLAEDAESDTDTDISHLIDQLSLKSAQKPPPAPSTTSAGAGAAGAPPRRGSKMDMIRRKFSASSPTKSWTDLGSSGGAASLGRVRTRSRSSVSILDQKIILSGISGDDDSSRSSSPSEGTSSSSPIHTESARGARRSRRSGSRSEVSEQLVASGVDSAVPTVPSASSVQTETVPSAVSVETGSVETEHPTERSAQTEVSTEESGKTKSEPTLKSVSARKQARTVRSTEADSKSGSRSDSQSESGSEAESESLAVAARVRAAEASKLRPPAASRRSARRCGGDDPASTFVVRPHGEAELVDSARSDHRAARRQDRAKRYEEKRQDEAERSRRRPSKRHRMSSRQDRRLDDRSRNDHAPPDDTGASDRDRRSTKTSKPGDMKRRNSDSRSHRRAREALTLERTGRDTELVSPSERRRRRRRERDRHRERDASWPEPELERTDASESLVVSYQRRVARSAGGCRHCRRQAWPPPPPPVTVPPVALGGGGGGETVRLSGTDANSAVFMDADEDAVLSAILTQQVALTRHFLATQKHLHETYRRALRRTQRQVYTNRDDLKGSRRRRRRRGDIPSD